MRIDVRVRRALFAAPEKWSALAGQFSKPFRRRHDSDETGPLVVGFLCYVPGLPVRLPLPYGRERDVYRVKAAGLEGDRLVVYVA